MPRFEPFNGLRYESSLDLDRLIAPPYDIVGPAERDELASRNRANAIHIEIPHADRNLGLNPYENAARLLADWIGEGILLREGAAALYGYRMSEPNVGTTTGVIGALRLEDPGSEVLPHEQTLAKDETDRLELIRATRANLSPIWGMSLTEGLTGLLEGEIDRYESATDDGGVFHELWVIDDAAAIEAICLAISSNPVVLADGHHRYSVARRYRDEQREARDGVAGPEDFIMAFIVELEETQLHVGPIHRALSGTGGVHAVLEALEPWFEVVDAGASDESVLSAITSSQAFAMVSSEKIWLLTPRQEAYEKTGSDLDSSFVALVLEGLPGATSQHFHTAHEATDAVEKGDADVALLVRPVRVDQIREWAGAGKLMPPKSTYFFPKPRTGMVYRSLDS